MKKYLIFLLAILLHSNTFGQNLNGYKYVLVQTLTYQSGEIDIWGISSALVYSFSNKGFIVLTEKSTLPKELIDNPCLVLECYINHTNVTAGVNSVSIILKNCKDEIVYQNSGDAIGWSVQDDFNKATRRAFSQIKKTRHFFNPKLTPKLNLPSVEKTMETESSLKKYFDSYTLDELEGIYKSYQTDQLGYYKIGIKKFGNKYKAIIIEAGSRNWEKGEVKAIFEPSSMKGFYSTKWYMGNKVSFETFALLEPPAFLSIEVENIQTGEKETSKLIKMYPPAGTSSDKRTIGSGPKASGSGFVLTTDGVIATNAHVIKDASKIEVFIANEFGTSSFFATILLKDKSNDVALIKINDKNFMGFNKLPYQVINQAETGEDVFTIGYPLNTIMGENYKLTNGIISAVSGFNDDIRFFQITTPIQPGNSGGPLFNKDGNIIGLTTAKLNENAIGMSIENVNYAIKASYLLNLFNMLPQKNQLSKESALIDLDLKDQVKVLKNYVCLIKVY